ncbi:hypothetical protein F444_14478 [Phytophthora nicotianae P1976]|uniref:Uncharacterized protein n=1 Tax=Phytophthora nicotianae P1976 TaxID=1317066 RepID=A0A080ZQ42_PHYNI|nr:hypothetical protein F444_14478 [Phytophthora nicotianae P1976]
MKSTFSEEGSQYIISDNANAIRNVVSSVFGNAVGIFETASVDALALEANLQRSRQHNDSIKELLMKQIVFTETGKLSKADFFNSLCLAELDYEAAAGFLRKSMHYFVRFSCPNPCAETTPRELELLSQLFSALRQLNGIRKRRQVFVMVYDFATCICAGIQPKTPAALITKWNNMKQQSNAHRQHCQQDRQVH